MSLRRLFVDPLEGRTGVGTVIWVHGVLGSLAYSALGVLLAPQSPAWMHAYTVGGALYTCYVSIATYQCARNSKSALGRRTLRICAVLTLLMLPFLTYLEWSGALDLAGFRG